MNEHKPNIYQLRALLDDLRRLDRVVQRRGNKFVLVTEDIDDTLPDAPIPD